MDPVSTSLPHAETPAAMFGFDAEHLPRWERLLDDPSGWGRLARCFGDAELAEIDGSPRGRAAAAAGIWAAKESVIKARGRSRPTGIRDVEIVWSTDGRRMGTCHREPSSTHLVSWSYAGDFVFAAAWSPLRAADQRDAGPTLRTD